MTVSKLHKLLGELIQQGHKRKPVCVDKPTFTDNCEEDGVVILDVSGVEVRPIPMMDEDGGTKIRQNGEECYRQTAVIYGGLYAPSK